MQVGCLSVDGPIYWDCLAHGNGQTSGDEGEEGEEGEEGGEESE